jgi:hypothetical protein
MELLKIVLEAKLDQGLEDKLVGGEPLWCITFMVLLRPDINRKSTIAKADL